MIHCLSDIGYVEPELAHEYELVMVAEAQLTGYLAQLPRESRLNAFRHILRHTRLRNSLKLPPLQDVASSDRRAGRSEASIASQLHRLNQHYQGANQNPRLRVKAEVVESAGEPTKIQSRWLASHCGTHQPFQYQQQKTCHPSTVAGLSTNQKG
jgi:hypothetical protein